MQLIYAIEGMRAGGVPRGIAKLQVFAMIITVTLILEDLGVSLYWHAQRIETLLPTGRRNPAASIMFSLLAEMARAERETLSDRIKSGLRQAAKKGRYPGRPKGTTMSSEDILEKYPKVVRQLRAGQSVRHTASICKVQ